jgi:carbon-monoxide dehydrogenase medium subunit
MTKKSPITIETTKMVVGGAAGAGAITGFPTIWAQEIKDIELPLGATIVTSTREIAADQFFRGMFETALAPGELITAVKLPIPLAAGYAKMPNQASRFALVGVFVAKFADGVRVAVTGAAPAVFRVTAFEAALAKRFEPGAVNGHGVDPAGLSSDIHAEAAFRAHLISVMAKRAVTTALANS